MRLTALGHVSSSANGIGFPASLWFAGTNASVAVDYQLEFGAVEVDFESDKLFSVGWAYATVTLPPQMMVNS
jgi:hypothetical protein